MSTEIRRFRTWKFQGGTGTRVQTHISSGTVTLHSVTPVVGAGSQTTWSRDTLFPRYQRQRQRARARGHNSAITRMTPDIGGPFATVKFEYSDDGCHKRHLNLPNITYIGNRLQYSGPLMGLNPGGSYFPVQPAASTLEMQQLGTTAIARTIPTNPAVGVGTLIGESMERLPSLPGKAILGRPGNVSKKFADEYLNYEFGLKPMVSDIQSIYQTVKDSNRILDQLERDSGRLVRRRYSFPVERTDRIVQQGTRYSYPPLHTAQYDGPGPFTVREVQTKRVWFSGAYTYHYSQGSDLWSRLKRTEQQFNRLFGLRLTPELVWELSPWSWAADWVTNAGDVLANISAFSRDGLVLQWGYVMMEVSTEHIHSQEIRLAGRSPYHVEQRFKTTVKKRIHATPYGFGLDPDWMDFSARQLAILGALGITRGR